MITFPTLTSGAVVQYPVRAGLTFSTQIVRFVDGSEQRFREFVAPLHRWSIQLDRLKESELNRLREFFRIVDGGAEPFSFTDPCDGVVYPNCSLDTADMVETLDGPFRGATTLVVTENRS